MNATSLPSLRAWIRGGSALGLTALLAGASVSGALAFDGSYGKGERIGTNAFAASSYNVTVDKTLYQYETGTDGKAYYAAFDGKHSSDWQIWPNQPADFSYDPVPVVYKGERYVTYHGEDGTYYLSIDGGDWTDISGGLTFNFAPYANVYHDTLYIYGTGSDGHVYWLHYDGTTWSPWIEIGDQTTSAYEPYAIDWNGYDNVFWTSDDGNVYWNRWDGSRWTGTTALPGDRKVRYAPFAVGYAPDKRLYAYSVTAKGVPTWNVFTEGKGWSGWTAFTAPNAKVVNQPNAYVDGDVQRIVYTGDDGHAYYTEYDGKWSNDWQDLGGNYAYDPYQYEYDGDLYLTYTGANAHAYVKKYEAGNSSGY